VLWPHGVERLPETYALERSNANFDNALALLTTATLCPVSATVLPAGPIRETVRSDGEGEGAQRVS
jgi:hypothetical protein